MSTDDSDFEQPSTSSALELEDEPSRCREKIDYRNFRMEQYVEEFPWLYYNPVEKGFKCKYCELFPAAGKGNYFHKLGKEAAKSLGDHPHRFLERHEDSDKHQKSVTDYEG